MPLPSLGHFTASATSLFPTVNTAITELPLLLSGQSAAKAWPINQQALQALHIQTSLYLRDGVVEHSLERRAMNEAERAEHLSL